MCNRLTPIPQCERQCSLHTVSFNIWFISSFNYYKTSIIGAAEFPILVCTTLVWLRNWYQYHHRWNPS